MLRYIGGLEKSPRISESWTKLKKASTLSSAFCRALQIFNEGHAEASATYRCRYPAYAFYKVHSLLLTPNSGNITKFWYIWANCRLCVKTHRFLLWRRTLDLCLLVTYL